MRGVRGDRNFHHDFPGRNRRGDRNIRAMCVLRKEHCEHASVDDQRGGRRRCGAVETHILFGVVRCGNRQRLDRRDWNALESRHDILDVDVPTVRFPLPVFGRFGVVRHYAGFAAVADVVVAVGRRAVEGCKPAEAVREGWVQRRILRRVADVVADHAEMYRESCGPCKDYDARVTVESPAAARSGPSRRRCPP